VSALSSYFKEYHIPLIPSLTCLESLLHTPCNIRRLCDPTPHFASGKFNSRAETHYRSMVTSAGRTGERQPLLSQARPSDIDKVNGGSGGMYRSADAGDEQSQPLLRNGQPGEGHEGAGEEGARPPATPLPKLQIFIVCSE
jgi:hypothetical protein